MNEQVIDANVEVHSRMASSYNSCEPHFRPENQAKVRKRLEDLRANAPGGRMLDLGCGTGFLIHLAADLFDDIHGVDVTQAMLDQIDTSAEHVQVHCVPAEQLPFENSSFDVVTAYSFIHHTSDYSKILKEAFRVLRPDGLLYIDLEPNRQFWSAMSQLTTQTDVAFSQIVQREVDSVLHTDERVEEEYGIPRAVFQQAEFTKAILGGIDPEQLRTDCKEIGFSDCDVHLDWFLGQGSMMHNVSFEAAQHIDDYLKQLGPLSTHLYKYLWCICRK